MQWFDYVAFAPTALFSGVELTFNHAFNWLVPAAFALVFFAIGIPQKKAAKESVRKQKARHIFRALGWIGGILLVAYLAWGVLRIVFFI